jgi:hypothetical protein
MASSVAETAALSRKPSSHRTGRTRQIGMRGHTEFSVVLYDGVVAAHCRATDLSTTGIVVNRGHAVEDDESGIVRLELYIPHAPAPIKALARPVRQLGSEQALRFVAISDADRLTLGEHLDRQCTRTAGLH